MLKGFEGRIIGECNDDGFLRLSAFRARVLLGFADTAILCYTNMMACRFAEVLFELLPGGVRRIYILMGIGGGFPRGGDFLFT